MTEELSPPVATATVDPRAEREFESLYGQYHQFVHRALKKHYVSATDLEDVTQEVFLVLLARIDEAAQKRSLGGWLYQIVRRVAANHHRGDRRRTRKHGALSSVPNADTGGAGSENLDPEQIVARAEARDLIRAFLESLDEEACAVFVMSEIEGLRGAEIASRLGISLPMTYARIRSVRARFGQRVAHERKGVWAMLPMPNFEVVTQVWAMGWKSKAGLAIVASILLWLVVGLGMNGGGGPRGPGGTWIDGGVSSQGQGDARGRSTADRTPRNDAEPGVRRAGAGIEGLALVRARFGGLVVDPKGKPIPGAIVCGDRRQVPDHRLTQPPTCETSDAAGRFEIRGALAEAHTLEAMAQGYFPGLYHGQPGGGIRIVLRPGGAGLEGRVVDVHGGPVEGAWVSVENRGESTLGVTVMSDEDGRFSLWVRPGPVSLGAGADGYATAFAMTAAPTKDLRLELSAESSIAGVTVDAETGVPMAGVRVGALMYSLVDRYASRQGTALSDAQGRWEISGLAPNHYALDAVGPASMGRASKEFDLGIGEYHDGVRIEMVRGTEIFGRIVNAETGENCSEGYALTHDKAQRSTRQGRVGAKGMVRMSSVTPGAQYVVTVSCRGLQTRQFEVDTGRDQATAENPARWPLAQGSQLAVRVIDGDDQPLPDWRIQLVAPRSQNFLDHRPNYLTTDVAGRALFAGLGPGEYKILAHGPHHPPLRAEKTLGTGERELLELRVRTGVRVVGTVLDARGQAVAGALVALQHHDNGRPPQAPGRDGAQPDMGRGPYQATTQADGSFVHPSVGAGPYGVWVVPRDAAVAHRRPTVFPGLVRHVPGAPMRTITVEASPITLMLRLDALSSIAGVVIDEEGDTLADARVFALVEYPGGRRDPRGRPVLSDERGRFQFDELVSESYTLVAYRKGGGMMELSKVQAGRADVELVFPRLARVTGRAVRDDGTLAEAFIVELHPASPGARWQGAGGSTQGQFELNGVFPGRYRLRAAALDASGEIEIEVEPGRDVDHLEVGLEPVEKLEGRLNTHFSGHLVDSKGQALTRWAVAVVAAGTVPRGPQDYIQFSPTGPDGKFLIREVPTSPVAIIAMPRPPSAERARESVALKIVAGVEGETTEVGDVVVGEAGKG